MHRMTIAYTIVAAWVFGWLTGVFGFLPAIFATVILGSPAFIAWRMVRKNRPIRQREYGYLLFLTALAVGGTVFVGLKWYERGMDRLAIFGREYAAFHRYVAAMPEYKDVEVSYTSRKGGRVYLHGAVDSKGSHDRLIQMVERMIHYNQSGYYDDVTYPGKTHGDEL